MISEDQIEELAASFVNGNISTVMDSLGEESVYDAMYMAVLVYARLPLKCKDSFFRALSRRTYKKEMER